METEMPVPGTTKTRTFRSILLIDDDAIANFINKRVLERTVTCRLISVALNGEEGLEILQGLCHKANECPEIIFLDLNMPVMDGFEFFEKFKKLSFAAKDSVKVVLLTTSGNEKDIQRALDLGVDCYHKKPLTEEKIYNIIEKLF